MRGANGANGNGHIRELSRQEGLAVLDRQTRRYFHMSAEEFIAAWQAGKFRDEHEFPHAIRLGMMIPLAG